MIVQLDECNIESCVFMANKLWPCSDIEELRKDFISMLKSSSEECFLYKTKSDKYIGFVQVSIRKDYVEGSSTSPVAYIEGIYVEEPNRMKGIALELINYSEAWGKERGCVEIASDCELDNTISIDFHSKIGFMETNRVVCFIKEIK
jgi:aminoglycoside 6'-N-acetyltransferase I